VRDDALAEHASAPLTPGNWPSGWCIRVTVSPSSSRARARSRCVSDFVGSVTSANSAALARVTDSGNSESPSANGRSTVSPPFSRSRPLSVPSLL